MAIILQSAFSASKEKSTGTAGAAGEAQSMPGPLCTQILNDSLLAASLPALVLCCPFAFILPLLPPTLVHFTASLHGQFLFFHLGWYNTVVQLVCGISAVD